MVLITLYICDAPSNFQQNGFSLLFTQLVDILCFLQLRQHCDGLFYGCRAFVLDDKKCSVKCTYSGDDESHHFITRTEHKLK